MEIWQEQELDRFSQESSKKGVWEVIFTNWKWIVILTICVISYIYPQTTIEKHIIITMIVTISQFINVEIAKINVMALYCEEF